MASKQQAPTTKVEPSEPDLGDYTDYLLLSSTGFTQGWKHNIMRLAPASASDAVEPSKWSSARLNRRDMRRIRREEEELARKAAAQAEQERLAKEHAEAIANGTANPDDPINAAGPGLPKYNTALRPGMPGFRSEQQIVKEERDESLVAPGPGNAQGKPVTVSSRRPRGGFGAPKKTRRVYITEESSKERRIRFEEQHPWMLETTTDDKQDLGPATRWIGKMDAAASAVANGGEGSSYVLFVLDNTPSSEAAFKVVPANRWYRFSSRPRHSILDGEQAEEEYKKMQKSGDMDIWFAQRRTAGPSASSAAMPSSSSATSVGQQAGRAMRRGADSYMGNGGSFGQSSSSSSSGAASYRARLAQARGADDSQSSARLGRFRTVVNDDEAREDLDDDEPAGPAGQRAGKMKIKPRRRAGLADDEYEEFDFEEDFQDDEEGIGQVGDEAIEEEDTKELEERIKREMRAANKVGEAVEDADEDDGIATQLTKAGKRVKKILKKRGRKGRPEEEEEDDFDDDDDEDDDETRNPYASEEDVDDDDDSEAERLKAEEEEAKRKQQQQSALQASQQGQHPPLVRNGSSVPKYPGSASLSRAPSSGPPGSRGASPEPALKNTPASNLLRRATSPSGRSSRAATPTPPASASKRKASPAEDTGSPPQTISDGSSTAAATSAVAAGNSSKRRKAGSTSPPPQAAAAVVPVAPGDDSALIPREQIVAFIRSNSPTTKELLRHFKTAMARDPRNKNVILQVTKEVASINEGKLSVKPEFV